MSVFDEFLFPLPPSILMKAMCVITLVSLMHFALSEVRGKHLQYSKFWNTSNHDNDEKKKEKKTEVIKVSSKIGMLILYTPAFLAGAISLWVLFPNSDLRFKLVTSALTLHFFKRDLEEFQWHFDGFPDGKPIVKNSNKMEEKKIMFSGRTGMLILYTPAFVAGVLSFWVFSNDMGDLKFMLVNSALTIHFFKRVFEVLFVHKYSGGMVIDSAIPISLSYFVSTASMIYNQHLLQGVPEPSIDLKYAGVVLFSVGILGNFYHHYLLSKLRAKDGEGYKIPKGGLFNIIICPHYLFEILIFVGISLISQSLYPISFTVGTAMYLTGRSYATRKWYLSKFPNFPKHVKALIPFVY